MNNLKPFDPQEIDETLTRVVTQGGVTYLLFPFVDALGAQPKFNSVGHVIGGPVAKPEDFVALSASVAQAAGRSFWFISFNTPWLIGAADEESIRHRGALAKPRRI